MSRHYKIEIHIAYDEASIPDNMQEFLDSRIAGAIEHGWLSEEWDAVVEDVKINVEEKK